MEFTFHGGQAEGVRNTVTQVMNFDDEEDVGAEAEADLLRNLRRLHEALVSGCRACRFDPVIDLGSNRHFGYVPRPDERLWGADDSLGSPAIGSHTASRLRRVQRTWALGQSARFVHDARVFLHVDAVELTEEGLADSLADFRRLLDNPARLVIVLPVQPTATALQTEVVADQLQQRGVAVALRGFTGRPGHAPPLPAGSPDYVILADALVRHLPGSSERQTWVQAVAGAGRERGWAVVAAGIHTAEERRWCRELGCALGRARGSNGRTTARKRRA